MKANELAEALEKYREIIITNLIMVAEIPAPLDRIAEARAEHIVQRLSEYNLLDVSLDEEGNVIAIISGTKDNAQNIALVAHMDTVHDENIDHTVRVETDTAIGIGLTDNSLGVAVLLSLPHILEDLNISFKNNIVLCFSSNSLGASDLKGTRFFIKHYTHKLAYGVCVEGYPLGRMSYHSLGAVRLKITLNVPEQYDWTRFGTANAIVELNNLMNSILEIPIPSRPKTSIMFNRVRGGEFLSTGGGAPQVASLHLDVRSESNELVESITDKIAGLVKELSSKSGIEAKLAIISKRKFGGLDYSHPLVQSLEAILEELDIPHRLTPSVSDLSAFIDANIPALTLGLTQCELYNSEKEVMKIKPMYKGISQLLSLIHRIDRGFKDE